MAQNPFEFLRMVLGFRWRRSELEDAATDARKLQDRTELASTLRTLGELERRTPFTQGAALKHYEEEVAIFRELNDPLKLAHTIRHLGLAHEDAGRLEEAEQYYDEALALYREHETADTLDYANAVRYPAVIKNRLGKAEESAKLWEEAHDRYAHVGIVDGVAESAGRLTLFALEKGDATLARDWFAKASEASEASSDQETHKFIAGVGAKLK